jgi:hypothetical protein
MSLLVRTNFFPFLKEMKTATHEFRLSPLWKPVVAHCHSDLSFPARFIQRIQKVSIFWATDIYVIIKIKPR